MGRLISACHRHTQGTASMTWTIIHNLRGNGSTRPIVDAIINDGGTFKKVLPNQVTVIDVNTVQLTFSAAWAGFATVVA